MQESYLQVNKRSHRRVHARAVVKNAEKNEHFSIGSHRDLRTQRLGIKVCNAVLGALIHTIK